MAYRLPALPYNPKDFGDLISEETFAFHHGKHHLAYVNKANELIEANPSLRGGTLLDLLQKVAQTGPKGLFNQIGQIWNHSFYWLGLSPVATQPSGELKRLIEEAFGSQDGLIAALKTEAVGHFASGWAALIERDGRLEVTSYHDADTPAAHDVNPLLIIDVWEHAYYIDYRNSRPDYVERLLRQGINWDFVASNLGGLGKSRADQSWEGDQIDPDYQYAL